nr:MAG TPA: hypothetical protein [Caudoviricetes sp.]
MLFLRLAAPIRHCSIRQIITHHTLWRGILTLIPTHGIRVIILNP